MADQAPLVQVVTAVADAVATGADFETPAGEAPFAGTVTAVKYIAAAAITGANTNTRLIQIINHKADGSGSAVVATLQFNSGTNAVADAETALTLSVVGVAQGDVLTFKSTHVGTGLADPGGQVRIEFTRA